MGMSCQTGGAGDGHSQVAALGTKRLWMPGGGARRCEVRGERCATCCCAVSVGTSALLRRQKLALAAFTMPRVVGWEDHATIR